MANQSIKRFNIRVYGLIVNENDEILVTDEYCQNQFMTKFPGGGLEFGEGLTEGLKREFQEECGKEIEIVNHFYTTDFFIESIFSGGGQLISVYYTCRFVDKSPLKTINKRYEGLKEVNDSIAFRWIALNSLSENDLSWPVDRHVVSLLKNSFKAEASSLCL